MKTGPFATKTSEPCQAWEGAAVREPFCVPKVYLVGANCQSYAGKIFIEDRCTV